MAYIIIEQHKILKLLIPKEYSLNNIQIGIFVSNGEDEKVGLKTIGDAVLPSAKFGVQCQKNAEGYSYVDKTQPKKKRYVSTNWIQPFGNDYASPVACDIYKECYPKVFVPPIGMEVLLSEDKNHRKIIVANLTDNIRKNHLIEAVNVFLELFEKCYVFDGDMDFEQLRIVKRCNWEILPPGEKPSIHFSKQLASHGESTDTFDVNRLSFLDRYSVESIVEGKNGFDGYYAYVFKNHCILESAKYGNATYIIPKENWEILSQKTKQELFDENVVIAKYVHNETWKREMTSAIRKLEKQ